MNNIRMIFIVSTIWFLSACSHDISDYKGSEPQFDLAEYFDGQVIAYGMVQDYSDKLTRQFCVQIIGSWQGNKGVLDETFYFKDGEQSKRIWELELLENGKVKGIAADVIGVAEGQIQGNVFQWQYDMTIQVDGSDYEVALDDWLYQQDKYRVFNRTAIYKFGMEVGQITIFFDKQTPHQSCASSAK